MQTTLTRKTKRPDAELVAASLEELCRSLSPGDRIPTHTELMRRFQASERAVLRALDDLRRSGRIVRRNGIGTFVAERPPENPPPATPSGAPERMTIVALTTPDGSFFDRCIELLFRLADDEGMTLICRPVDPEAPNLPTFSDADNNARGYILFRRPLADLGRQLQQQGARVVLIGAMPAGVAAGIPNVYGDPEQGGYLQVSHLISLGHRRIVFAHSGGDLRETIRWQGYLRALREARHEGKTIEHTLTQGEDWERCLAQPAEMQAFFARPDAPTAIVAWNDHEAARALSGLVRAGISVPDDVSLVGYDALPEGTLVYPQLTTIEPYTDRLIRAAVRLIAQPAETAASHNSVIIPTLLPRESTAPPKKAG